MGEPGFAFVPGREVRTISTGWEHPTDKQGRYVPLLPEQMPEPGSEVEIVAYETTTEGTPISPAFSDTPEGRLDLVRYCAEHCTTFADHRAEAEAWAVLLFGEGTVVTDDGVVEAD